MKKKYFTFNNCFLFIALFVLTIGQFLPVEIINVNLKIIFYIVLLVGLPITVYNKLKPYFLNLKNPFKKIVRIIILLVGAIYLFAFFVYVTFGLLYDMCGYSTKKIYVRKGNSNNTIILRGLSCGAYDSGGPKFETINSINIFSLIQFVPKIDTLKIDKNKWIKVASDERLK